MSGMLTTWVVLVVALAFVGLVVLAVVLAASGGDAPRSDRAHEILRQRLAAGEIDPEEFRERAQLLGPEPVASSGAPRWLAVLLAVLAVLLLLGLLAWGLGRPVGGWWPPWDGPMRGQMGGHMGGAPAPGDGRTTTPDLPDSAEEVVVEATEMAFAPDEVEVTVGEPVTLTLTNVGRTFHDLTVEGLDLRIGAGAGQTASAALEVDEPGEHPFLCSVPGHADAGMRGTLNVVAP